MKKLCIIYNFALHYRSEIFQQLDQHFDCDFFFGDSYLDVKKMDYSLLQGNVKELHSVRKGPLYYQKGMSSLIKKYDTFLILSETHNLSTWKFLVSSKIYKNKKIFCWTHGWYGKESFIESLLKKIFYSFSHGIFLYGNYARELMIKEGFNPNKLFVIHNSLSYHKQLETRKQLYEKSIYMGHFGNNNYNLIFIGRLTAVKKLDLILKAMLITRNNGFNYNLTFIGEGEKKDDLIKLSKKLVLDNSIWFFGACYDENVLGEMIYNADLCISPGNIGLTAMHSMVFGTPVITHNCFKYQMPEFEAIIDGETGTFFEMDSVESLAYQINNWFMINGNNRKDVRKACMREIDSSWNPNYQINVFKEQIK